MEGQMQISTTALDALVIQANYRMGSGWGLQVSARQNGMTWAQTPRRVYEYLTTDELGDVIAEEVGRLLG